jgi:hypothetical protein
MKTFTVHWLKLNSLGRRSFEAKGYSVPTDKVTLSLEDP